MNSELSKTLDNLLEYTTTLSFPRFSNDEKKKEILSKTKRDIDNEIMSKMDDVNPLMCIKDEIWLVAQELAQKEFVNLPGKLIINSFYYQEVMHQYVDMIKEKLL